MTINEIAGQVAFYLQKGRDSFLDLSGQDMIIAALNTARKNAELDHDFVYQQAEAWLSISPGLSASLASAKLVSGVTLTQEPAKVKTVDAVFMHNSQSGRWYPVYFDPKKASVTDFMTYHGRYAQSSLLRYQGDALDGSCFGQRRVIFQGQNLSFEPKLDQAHDLVLDCQLWMADYKPNVAFVKTASTSSTTIVLERKAPENFGVGSVIMGKVVTVANPDGVTFTLAGNAPETVAETTVFRYENPNGSLVNAGEDYTDWFTQHGYEYLKWAAVCELNLFTRQFVFRETGYMGPPEKARDQALQKLKSWDIFIYEQNRPQELH